ncbi:uncharacterized protein LOC121413617 [Lytechinus variegatus]|uniref:uncharacterized protein LOC121413617 n=1 Tax=Lytechinus variegatus TaxID=7654 RepID=UPI001BB21616|nr:uncharacterized protein LOC121413617 [Lytechinus variegatus]
MELDSEGINSQEELIICDEAVRNDDYEVEKITGMRLVKGKLWFRVRWKGYGADMATWEPRGNLNHCEELLEDYVSKVQAKKYKQKKRRQIQSALIQSVKKDQKEDDTNVTLGVNHAVKSKLQFNGTIMRKKMIKKFISKPNKFSNQTNQKKWSLNENPLDLVSLKTPEELPLETPNVEVPVKGRMKRRGRGRPKKKTTKMPDLQPQTEFSLNRQTCLETESQLGLDSQTCLQPQTQLRPNRDTSPQQETCLKSKTRFCPDDTEVRLQSQTRLCSVKETRILPGSRLCSDSETMKQPCPEIETRLQPTSEQCPEIEARLQPQSQPCPDREPLETVDDIILLEGNSVSQKKHDSVVKRGRGRPPKKKKRKELHEDLCSQKNPTNIRRKRGRPKKAVACGRVTKAKTYEHYNGQIKLKKVVIRELRSLKALLEFQRQISDEEKENKTNTYSNKEEVVPSTLEHRHVLASEYRNRFFIRIKTGSFKDQSTKRRRKRKEDKEKRKKKRESRRMVRRNESHKGKKELSDVKEICRGVEEDGKEDCALPEVVEISSSSEAGEGEEGSAESQMDTPSHYGYDDLIDFSKENSMADKNKGDDTIYADVQEVTEKENICTDNILQDVMTVRPKNLVGDDKEVQETGEADDEEAAAAADDESSSLVIPFDEEEEESSSLIIADDCIEDDDDDDDDDLRETVKEGEWNGVPDLTRAGKEQYKKTKPCQKSFEDPDSDEFIFENSGSETSETPQILEKEENSLRMSANVFRKEDNKREFYVEDESHYKSHEDITDEGEEDTMRSLEPMDLTFAGDSGEMVENGDSFMGESAEKTNFEKSESEVNSGPPIQMEMEMDKTEKPVNAMAEDVGDIRPIRASRIQVLDKCMEEEDFNLEMKTSEIFLKTRKDKRNHEEEKEEANDRIIVDECSGYRDLETRDDQSEPQLPALGESEKMRDSKKIDENNKTESGLECLATSNEHTLQENSDVIMMDSESGEDKRDDIENKGKTYDAQIEEDCKDNHLRTDANTDLQNPQVAELVKEAENELVSLSICPPKPLEDNQATGTVIGPLVFPKNDGEALVVRRKEESYDDPMEMQQKGLSETKELNKVYREEGKEVVSDVLDSNQSSEQKEIQDGKTNDVDPKEQTNNMKEPQGTVLSKIEEQERIHLEDTKQKESDMANPKESGEIEVVQDRESKDAGRKEEIDDVPSESQGLELSETKEQDWTHQEDVKQDESDLEDLKEIEEIEVVQDGEIKDAGRKEKNDDDPFEPQGEMLSETKEHDRNHPEETRQDEFNMADLNESAGMEKIIDEEMEQVKIAGVSQTTTKEGDNEADKREGGEDCQKIVAIGSSEADDHKEFGDENTKETKGMGELEEVKYKDEDREKQSLDLETSLAILSIGENEKRVEACDGETMETEVVREDEGNKQDHEMMAAVHSIQEESKIEYFEEEMHSTSKKRDVHSMNSTDEDNKNQNRDREQRNAAVLPTSINSAGNKELGTDHISKHTELDVPQGDIEISESASIISNERETGGENRKVECNEEMKDSNEERQIEGLKSEEQVTTDDKREGDSKEINKQMLPSSGSNEMEGNPQAEETDLETAAAVKAIERELGIVEVDDQREKSAQRYDKMNPEISQAQETEEYNGRDEKQRRVDDEEMEIEMKDTHGIAEKEMPKVEASVSEQNMLHQRDNQNLVPELKTIKEVEIEQMNDVRKQNGKEMVDQEKDEEEKGVRIPEITSAKTGKKSDTKANSVMEMEETEESQIDAKTMAEGKDMTGFQEGGAVVLEDDKPEEQMMKTNSEENLMDQGIKEGDIKCLITEEETTVTAAIRNGADNGCILEKETPDLSVKDQRDLGKVEHNFEKVVKVVESEVSKATCVHEEKVEETNEQDKLDKAEKAQSTEIPTGEGNLHAEKRRNRESRPKDYVKNVGVASKDDHMEIIRVDKKTISDVDTRLANDHLKRIGSEEKLTGRTLDKVDTKGDKHRNNEMSEDEAVANSCHRNDMESTNEGLPADIENKCDKNNRIPSPNEATEARDITSGNTGHVQEAALKDKVEVFESKAPWNSEDALDLHISLEERIEVSGKTTADNPCSNLDDTPDEVDLYESKDGDTSTKERAKTTLEELEEGELPEDDEEDVIEGTDGDKEEGEITEDIEDLKYERTRTVEIGDTPPVVTDKTEVHRHISQQVRRRSQESIDVNKINSDHQTTHCDVQQKSITTVRSAIDFNKNGSYSTKDRRRSTNSEPNNAIPIDEDDEIEVLETNFSRKVNRSNSGINSLENDVYIVHEEPAKPGVRLRSHRRKSTEQAKNRTAKSSQNCETLSTKFGSGLKKVSPNFNSHVSKGDKDGNIARKVVHSVKAHLHQAVNGPKEFDKSRESVVEKNSTCQNRVLRPKDSVSSDRQDYLFNRIEVGSGDAGTYAGKGGTKRKSDEEDDSDSGFQSRPKKKHAGKSVWQMVQRKEKKPDEPVFEGNTKINRQKIVIKISKKLLSDQPETNEPQNITKRKESEKSSSRHSWNEGEKMEVTDRDEGYRERRMTNRVEDEPKEKREKAQVNGRGGKTGSSSSEASRRSSSLPNTKQDKNINDTNLKNGRESKTNSKSMSSDLLKDLKKLKAHGIKQGDLPWVKDLLGTKHVACLSEVCAALTKFMDSKDHKINLVVEMGFCPVLVNLLRSESSEVISSALLAVSHIVSGNDYQTQAVLECSPLPLFCNFLSRHKHDVTLRKEACLALSNITAGTSQQIQHLVNDGLFPVLLSAMQHDEFQVMYEATWAVANATVNGSPEQIRYIVKQGFFQAFSEILKHNDDTLIQIALDAMYNVLKLDTKHKKVGKTTPYCRQVKEFGGLQRIRNVRLSGSTVVKKKAYNMLTTFFPDF